MTVPYSCFIDACEAVNIGNDNDRLTEDLIRCFMMFLRNSSLPLEDRSTFMHQTHCFADPNPHGRQRCSFFRPGGGDVIEDAVWN